MNHSIPLLPSQGNLSRRKILNSFTQTIFLLLFLISLLFYSTAKQAPVPHGFHATSILIPLNAPEGSELLGTWRLSGYLTPEAPTTIFSISAIRLRVVPKLPEYEALELFGFSECRVEAEEFDVLPEPSGIRPRVLTEVVKPSIIAISSFSLPSVPSFRPPLQPFPTYHFSIDCDHYKGPDTLQGVNLELNVALTLEFREALSIIAPLHVTLNPSLITSTPDLPQFPQTFWQIPGPISTQAPVPVELVSGVTTAIFLEKHRMLWRGIIVRELVIKPMGLWSPKPAAWHESENPNLYSCTINGFPFARERWSFMNYHPQLPIVGHISLTLEPWESEFLFQPFVPIAINCNAFLWTTHNIYTMHQIGDRPVQLEVLFKDGDVVLDAYHLLPTATQNPDFPILSPSTLSGLYHDNKLYYGVRLDTTPSMGFFPDQVTLQFQHFNCLSGNPPGYDSPLNQTSYINNGPRRTVTKWRPNLPFPLYDNLEEAYSHVTCDLRPFFSRPIVQFNSLIGGVPCQAHIDPKKPMPVVALLKSRAKNFLKTSDSYSIVTLANVLNVRTYPQLASGGVQARAVANDPRRARFEIDFFGQMWGFQPASSSYQVEIRLESHLGATFSGALRNCHAVNRKSGKLVTNVVSYQLKGATDIMWKGTGPLAPLSDNAHGVGTILMTFDWMAVQTEFGNEAELAAAGLSIICPGVFVHFIGPDLEITHWDRLVLTSRRIIDGIYADPGQLRQSLVTDFRFSKLPHSRYQPSRLIFALCGLIVLLIVTTCLTGAACCQCWTWKRASDKWSARFLVGESEQSAVGHDNEPFLASFSPSFEHDQGFLSHQGSLQHQQQRQQQQS